MDKNFFKVLRNNLKDPSCKKQFFNVIQNAIECASCEHLKDCPFRYLHDHTTRVNNRKIYCQRDYEKSIEKMMNTKLP